MAHAVVSSPTSSSYIVELPCPCFRLSRRFIFPSPPLPMLARTNAQWVLKRMGVYERHPSVTEQAVSSTWKISLALFINSACVVLLVNIPDSFTVSAKTQRLFLDIWESTRLVASVW